VKDQQAKGCFGGLIGSIVGFSGTFIVWTVLMTFSPGFRNLWPTVPGEEESLVALAVMLLLSTILGTIGAVFGFRWGRKANW
jgi:uncharacterized membrane protein YfcA